MMKFHKIVCLDNTQLNDWALEELQKYSEAKIVHPRDYPQTEKEILKRIGEAEVVFLSWKTRLNERVIEQCPHLKYIGMCCSLYDDASANVAVNFAKEQGITVRGIRDYGDPGVAEFIISELIRLLHGYGKQQWKAMPVELRGRKIGIIGLGVTGQLLAGCLLGFGVDLFYFSRTRKEQWEERGVKYLPLKHLLETSQIISLHLPKNTRMLKAQDFKHLGRGKILVNTSLGLPFEGQAFKEWIGEPSNFAIFDGDGKKDLPRQWNALPNIVTASTSAGWSAETQQRLSEKVLANFIQYIASSS